MSSPPILRPSPAIFRERRRPPTEVRGKGPRAETRCLTWPGLSLADFLLHSLSAGRSSTYASLDSRGRALAFCLFRLTLENVAKPAKERLTDRIERGEADRERAYGFPDVSCNAGTGTCSLGIQTPAAQGSRSSMSARPSAKSEQSGRI
jgi:hypothetical protein